jgi:hypothetical protein
MNDASRFEVSRAPRVESATEAGSPMAACTPDVAAHRGVSSARSEERRLRTMAFTRKQIRDSIERASDEHWQALIDHHTDAYPESNPTPGDVARAEAARLNDLGLGDDPNLELVESRVERVEPAVRITHVFEDRAKGTRFETEPFTGYE